MRIAAWCDSDQHHGWVNVDIGNITDSQRIVFPFFIPHRDDRLRETLEGKSCISKFLLQYINTPSSISANNQAEP